MKSDIEKWVETMRIGQLLCCHQMPNRSFFWRGYQLPVCARCLGVIIGHILAVIIFPFYQFSLILAVTFCLVTFIDWFLQYLNIFESTNWRRLVTGILGGIGVVILPISLLSELYLWSLRF